MSIPGRTQHMKPRAASISDPSSDMPALQVFSANPIDPANDITLKLEAHHLTIEILKVMGASLVQEIINFVAEDHTGKQRMLIKDDEGKEICSVIITIGVKHETDSSHVMLSTEIWIDKVGGIYDYGARVFVTESMACQIIDQNMPLKKLIDLPEGITVPIKQWVRISGKNLIRAEFTYDYTKTEDIILTGTPAKKATPMLREYIRNNMS